MAIRARILAAPALALLLLAGGAITAAAYEPGTSGLLFLRLGVGERAAGMGEAYTALAADATALYWNPAGLAAVERTQVHFMHNEWISSVRQEFAGLAHPTRYGTFAVGITGLNMDELELREELPSSEPLGHFSAFDIAVHGAYGRELLPGVQAGLGVKWIYSRLYEENAKGFLVDLGLRHETKIPGLTLGAALLHFGAKFKYVSEEFDAPRTIKLGAAWLAPFHPAEGDVRLAYDLLLLSDSDTSTDADLGASKSLNARNHVGVEYDYQGLAALRAGYKAGYDSQGLSVGAGLRWHQVMFDYAFLAVSNDLGSVHRLGLTLDI
ncbi:MAG: PorV/PorQ family protein [Candidatus Krumholzibacteriia bacterium]|nr:PorV/PorQ family protein [bacterium]MCB9512709.1 PorV/PorQ family protein [Candidatus Latescibacterota bacterium]MCB9516793.1 PorV/PorQ family protein [Candidatus Latescibacterota bacterium]